MLDLETYDFDKRRCANCLQAKLDEDGVSCATGREFAVGRNKVKRVSYAYIMRSLVTQAKHCAGFEMEE
uniref:Uncharacterized protein n=1 Tax=viral metagenome TaxID=1070528 RepID=A0A6M3XW52_9ZZZZ